MNASEIMRIFNIPSTRTASPKLSNRPTFVNRKTLFSAYNPYFAFNESVFYALGPDLLDVRHQCGRVSRSRQYLDRWWIHREGVRLRPHSSRMGTKRFPARIRILSSARRTPCRPLRPTSHPRHWHNLVGSIHIPDGGCIRETGWRTACVDGSALSAW